MRRIGIIGPGRVGTALAIGLQRAGEEIASVSDRPEGSSTLARFRALFPDADVVADEQVPRDVDLVLVTTPDDQIVPTGRRLAAADAIEPGQRWVHTAGGRGADALATVAAAGGRVAACHPAMTFPDAVRAADALPGTSWAVTASAEDLDWARLLVLQLRGSPVTLAARDRTLYHAGLAVGSNGTTAVVTLARDLLLGAGVEDPAAFLSPLVAASATGGAAEGVGALTGPVQRGDVGTVAAHLRELASTFPEAVEPYVALAHLILGQAARGGLDPDLVQQMRGVLDELGA